MLELLPGFCQRENVLLTIGTDYRLHECLEPRQSVHLLNAYQDQDKIKTYFVDEVLFGELSKGGTAIIDVVDGEIKISKKTQR